MSLVKLNVFHVNVATVTTSINFDEDFYTSLWNINDHWICSLKQENVDSLAGNMFYEKQCDYLCKQNTLSYLRFQIASKFPIRVEIVRML